MNRLLSLLFSFGIGTLFAASSSAQIRPDKGTRPPLYNAEDQVIGGENGGGAGGKYGGRRGGRRRLGGSSAGLRDSIHLGLEWMRRHQDADGGFDASRFMRHDKRGKKSNGPGEGLGRAGITGFCLLAFLGDGNALKAGPYSNAVRKAVGFLRKQQHPESGAYSRSLLEHAVATYAMAEVTGLSRSTVLGKEVTAALDHLIQQQNPDGGFRFDGPSKSKIRPADSFTTLHAMLAYKAGLDFGLVEAREPLRNMEHWLDSMNPSPNEVDTPPIVAGKNCKETAIAAKLFAQFFLGRPFPPSCPTSGSNTSTRSIQPPLTRVDVFRWPIFSRPRLRISFEEPCQIALGPRKVIKSPTRFSGRSLRTISNTERYPFQFRFARSSERTRSRQSPAESSPFGLPVSGSGGWSGQYEPWLVMSNPLSTNVGERR